MKLVSSFRYPLCSNFTSMEVEQYVIGLHQTGIQASKSAFIQHHIFMRKQFSDSMLQGRLLHSFGALSPLPLPRNDCDCKLFHELIRNCALLGHRPLPPFPMFRALTKIDPVLNRPALVGTYSVYFCQWGINNNIARISLCRLAMSTTSTMMTADTCNSFRAGLKN